MSLRAVIHASEILTGKGIEAEDGVCPIEGHLDPIVDGAIVYSERKIGKKKVPDSIVWMGPTSKMPKKYLRVSSKNLRQLSCVTAGWIDCHTHLVFGGDRSSEFARRCAGATYQEIADAGGGIASTVRATREASIASLVNSAKKRLGVMEKYGVKTIEIKTGYGLTLESERKMLLVIEALRKAFPHLTLSATFMAAHAIPKELTEGQYVQEILSSILPQLAKEFVMQGCDAFLEKGYFQKDSVEKIIHLAKKLGLNPRIHADELTDGGGAEFAVKLGARSVDHLIKVSDAGIQALARSSTVAVLLPCTSMYLKESFAPGRKMLDQGVRVALATDCNPGSSMCFSLPLAATLGALYYGMSRAEVLAGLTYNPAKVLGLAKKKGSLAVGKDADFTILPFSRFEEAYYQVGWLP